MTQRFWSFAAALLLLHTAAPAQDAPKTTPKPPAAVGMDSGAPVVHLLEAGVEPRRKLRYAPAAGDKSSLTMTMKMGMQMTMGEHAAPKTTLPAMVMVMNIEVQDVDPNGDITYSMKLVDTSVGESTPDFPADSLERMRTVLKSMVGFAGNATVTSRGETKEANFQMPENADQSMKDMMDSMKNSLKQMSSPLPEEAVGPGAKWEVATHVTGRLNLDQTATATLTELQGPKFHLSMDIVQSAARQEVQVPVPGSKVELVSLTSTGAGKVDGELGSILPVASHVKLSSSQKMEITSSGSDKPAMMTQGMDMDMDIKKGPPAASPEPAKPEAPKAK